MSSRNRILDWQQACVGEWLYSKIDSRMMEQCLNQNSSSDFYPFPAEEGEFGLMSPVGVSPDANNYWPLLDDANDADNENSMHSG